MVDAALGRVYEAVNIFCQVQKLHYMCVCSLLCSLRWRESEGPQSPSPLTLLLNIYDNKAIDNVSLYPAFKISKYSHLTLHASHKIYQPSLYAYSLYTDHY